MTTIRSLDGRLMQMEFIPTGTIDETTLETREPICFPPGFRVSQSQYYYDNLIGIATAYDWMGTGYDHTYVIRQGTQNGGPVRGWAVHIGKIGNPIYPVYTGLQHRGETNQDPFTWVIGVEIPPSAIPSGTIGWLIFTFPLPSIPGTDLDILFASWQPVDNNNVWVAGYGLYPNGAYSGGEPWIWNVSETVPTPHWTMESGYDLMFALLYASGMDCWKCLNPPDDCVLCGGHDSCDPAQGNYLTQTACETLSNCGGAQTYDCWQCDTPGSPCVLHTGLPNPCNGTTTFTTKDACEAATGCETGPANGVITNMSANPNPVSYGGSSTVSLTGQNTGTGPAYFAFNIWRDTYDWEYATLNPGESFTHTRTFSNITSNQLIWGYLWRWNAATEIWILDDEADVLIQLEQPADLCQWITDHGGAHGLDLTEVFIIIDSYIYQTPPTGYSFTPTLQQVFGVIDYYLGFDGDPLTGCDFY